LKENKKRSEEKFEEKTEKIINLNFQKFLNNKEIEE
jgi:hypothetical protein